jgi:hypothetical protein
MFKVVETNNGKIKILIEKEGSYSEIAELQNSERGLSAAETLIFDLRRWINKNDRDRDIDKEMIYHSLEQGW